MQPLTTTLRRASGRAFCCLCVVVTLGACAGPKLVEAPEPLTPTYASPAAETGVIAGLARVVADRHGPEVNGFRLLSTSKDALMWRLALIDSAETSLDIMTYLWYPDVTGTLILERALLAAQRGVRVRLVVDDLLTIGQDQVLADIQSHENVEVRLFNPWKNRSLGARAGEMIAEMERLNTRMHDKLLIVDGRAVILGGRNIGDHYFGLSDSYIFRDLDVLAVGPLGQASNGMFDDFWNSEWLSSAAQLSAKPGIVTAVEAWKEIQQNSREAPELQEFPRAPKDWSVEFEDFLARMHPGTAELIYDEAEPDVIEQNMIGEMFSLFDRANEELIVVNAYVIPGDPAIEFVQSLTDRGVDIRILTNSLESHDVPAVNAHYESWRDDLISAGVDLYEMRATPAIRDEIEIPPMKAEFFGLHSKGAVIDRKTVFIGSMNLDPRSANINTEMGAIIESPGLAEELRKIFLRDMQPENAWHVYLNEDGELRWVNSEETVDSQPSRGFMQDIMNTILKLAPKDLY